MKRVLLALLCLMAIHVAAQSSRCEYFDAQGLLVKRVVQNDAQVSVTYHDSAGREIGDICVANPRVLTYLEERSLRQLISKYLPRDSTQSIRTIGFCFLIGSGGTSNVRILKSDVRCQSVVEIEAIVSKALLEAHLDCPLDCLSYIEATIVEEVSYPIRVEKKAIYYDAGRRANHPRRREK